MVEKRQLTALSDFRYRLARFLRFSERAARGAGLTPTQYLLLLHIGGTPGRRRATVGELAERLQASPHGTAALVARCVARGLVSKRRRASDARIVDVGLTRAGARRMARVAVRHRDELQSLGDVVRVAHVG